MCPPAVIGLAAAGLAAAGSIMGGLQANAQAKYQARVAERNAALANEAARTEIENTRIEAMAHDRRVGQLVGQQRVAAAANGVALDFGTAADVVADTSMLANEDKQRLYDRGYEAVRGRDIEASNYTAEANAQRAAGKGAVISGFMSAASTALGGVSQYKKMKAAG